MSKKPERKYTKNSNTIIEVLSQNKYRRKIRNKNNSNLNLWWLSKVSTKFLKRKFKKIKNKKLHTDRD